MSPLKCVYVVVCMFAVVCIAFGRQPDWRDSLESGRNERMLGHFAQAEPLLREALDGARIYGSKTDIADALSETGDVYLSEDRFLDAERAYTEALSNYPKADAATRRAVITRRNLGTAFTLEARPENALTVLNDALRLAKSNPDLDSTVTAEILNAIACVYIDQRNYKKAQSLLLEVIRMRSTETAPDFVTSNALTDLADIHRDQRKYDEAEKEYLRSLEIIDQVIGPSHPEAAITHISLGVLYLRAGRLDEAKTQLLESLRIIELANPVVPDRIIRSLHLLSEIYVRQGDLAEAEAALARAVKVARQNPSGDFENAAVLDAYSVLLKQLGKSDEARTTHAEAVRARTALSLVVPLHGPR